ncbi:hypothetical protein C444_08860 [Haloarcula japonica DSM 6131]|uniref:DUF7344 domain-containing protein n=2 Tax=Haloarcula japonica TaxID=29282 RepID=M0LBU4_HALJT|nr:hypothetical protein C444_08860 [Haloarcula japonica DSM 6131]
MQITMTKTQHTANEGSTDSDLSVTTIFELLTSERRRRALQYLTQAVGAVPISDLADQLTLWEGEHTREQYERVCTSLFHVHLPKMADAGVVQYDPACETVHPQEAIEQITPYLELAGLSDR